MPIDYSKYPPNWKTEIVPRILARADNNCETCGVENKAMLWSYPIWMKEIRSDKDSYKIKRIWTNDETCIERLRYQTIPAGEIKKIRVVLTIAHLDHDEENHEVTDDRLKAMCQSCHLCYDATEKHRRVCQKASEIQQSLAI